MNRHGTSPGVVRESRASIWPWLFFLAGGAIILLVLRGGLAAADDGGGVTAATGTVSEPAPKDPRTPDPRTLGELRRLQGAERTASDASPSGRGLLRVAGTIVFALLLAGGTVFFLRRYAPGGTRADGERWVEVLARTPVAPKHQVVVVRVADRTFVLGVSPDRIAPISEIPDPRRAAEARRSAGFQGAALDREARFEFPPPDETDAGNGRSPGSIPAQKEIERLRGLVSSWREGGRRGEDAP